MFGKILYTLFTRFFASLMQAAVIVMASHFYGAEGKGIIALLHSDIVLLVLGSQLLGGLAMIYHTPDKNPFQLFLISTLWNLAIISLALPYIVQLTHTAYWSNTDLWWLAILQSGINTHLMLLLGRNRVTSYNRVIIFQAIITFCALIGLNIYMPRLSTHSYIYALFFSWGATWLVSFVSISRIILPISFKQIHFTVKDLFITGLPIQFILLIEFILLKGQLFFMNLRNSSLQQAYNIGVFSNAISVAEALGLLTVSIALVEYAKLSNVSEILIKRKKGVKVFRVGMSVSMLILAFIWWLPDTFYSYLFGAEFTGMQKIVRLMVPGMAGLAITRILGAYYFGSGRSWIPMVTMLSGVLLSILLFRNDVQQQWDAHTAAYSFTLAYLLSGTLLLSAFFVFDKINPLDLIPHKEDLTQLKEQIKEMRIPRENDMKI